MLPKDLKMHSKTLEKKEFPNSELLTIAAFDFDGTITTGDSLLVFLKYAAGSWNTFKSLFLLAPFLIGFLFKCVSRQKVKEKILSRFFAGMPINWMKELGDSFAYSKELEKMIRPSARQRLAWHQKQGHRCVLISATLDIYLIPWAKQEGFHDVLSSKLEANSSGVVTGRLEGLNCWGAEKTRRLQETFGPQKGNYILYAYGDSRGDWELLAAANYPFSGIPEEGDRPLSNPEY